MKWHRSLRFQTVPGASDDEIQVFLDTVFSPLTDAEASELMDEHQRIVGDGYFDPPFRPQSWRLPQCSLPDGYVDFLRWSNGGFFEGTHRDLDPLFSTKEVRDYMLGYSIPHWMPEACPIGFDGGGGFYLFDGRRETPSNDYPVVWAHAGSLDWDAAVPLASSFREFIDTALGRSPSH